MENYFCGWYIKCQNGNRTVAFIPAYHITGGVGSCSIQIITDGGAWNVSYPFSRFRKEGQEIRIGRNRFGKTGCHLEIRENGVCVQGDLTFGTFTPLAYDIMGPFRYVPFMQCRHSVFSMRHRVDGVLAINGEEFLFDGGVGYMEGDRGSSFPKEYLWTQCSFPAGSLMLSVADIPFCGIHFTGVIGVIWYRGKEYRLATYLGARAVRIHRGEAVIRQGGLRLTVRRLEDRGRPLAAPVGGDMKRTIRESAACKSYYCLQEHGRTIFEFLSDSGSFEYEYPQ